MSLKGYILLLFSFLIAGNAQSQDIIMQANAAYNNGDFLRALDLYNKYKAIGTDPDLLQRRGMANFHLNRLKDATRDFTKAKQEGNTSPELFFKMAQSYQHLSDFEKATFFYKNYLNLIEPEHKNYNTAFREIKNCTFSAFHKEETSDDLVQSFGSEVNTLYDEIFPIQSPQAGNIYYASTNKNKKHFELKSFVLNREGEWSTNEDFGESLNTSNNDFAMDIDGNGQSMLLYTSDHEGRNKSFFSTLNESNESIEIELPADILPGAVDVFIIDHNTLAFASDKLEGYGGYDIYTIEYKDGQWSEPLNEGPAINTENDERSPFYARDGRHIFFSSNRPYAHGGFDIYHIANTIKNPIAKNLGTPVNSAGHDLGFRLDQHGQQAVFCSDRKTGIGGFDLYFAYMQDIKKLIALDTVSFEFITDVLGLEEKEQKELAEKARLERELEEQRIKEEAAKKQEEEARLKKEAEDKARKEKEIADQKKKEEEERIAAEEAKKKKELEEKEKRHRETEAKKKKEAEEKAKREKEIADKKKRDKEAKEKKRLEEQARKEKAAAEKKQREEQERIAAEEAKRKKEAEDKAKRDKEREDKRKKDEAKAKKKKDEEIVAQKEKEEKERIAEEEARKKEAELQTTLAEEDRIKKEKAEKDRIRKEEREKRKALVLKRRKEKAEAEKKKNESEVADNSNNSVKEIAKLDAQQKDAKVSTNKKLEINSKDISEYTIFYEDRHDLLASTNREKLLALSLYLDENTDHKVCLIAHTDANEPGLPEFVQYNTLKRAMRLADFLVDEGVRGDRISIESVANNFPVVRQEIAGKENQDNFYLNKRIDIQIRDKKGRILQDHNVMLSELPSWSIDRRFELYKSIREELYYSVKIADAKRIFKNAILRLYNDIYVRKESYTADNEYYIGVYTNVKDAIILRDQLKDSSSPMSELVAFYNGKKINLDDIDALITDYPDLAEYRKIKK